MQAGQPQQATRSRPSTGRLSTGRPPARGGPTIYDPFVRPGEPSYIVGPPLAGGLPVGGPLRVARYGWPACGWPATGGLPVGGPLHVACLYVACLWVVRCGWACCICGWFACGWLACGTPTRRVACLLYTAFLCDSRIVGPPLAGGLLRVVRCGWPATGGLPVGDPLHVACLHVACLWVAWVMCVTREATAARFSHPHARPSNSRRRR